MLEAGLNVDNNYCHNAFGSVDRPWCYFDNISQAWGYCDIPTCEDFCGHHVTEPHPVTQRQLTTAYITSTPTPKSIRPTKHPKGNRDPFVLCWNKCFNDGRENGSNCMDICMKVSLINLTT